LPPRSAASRLDPPPGASLSRWMKTDPPPGRLTPLRPAAAVYRLAWALEWEQNRHPSRAWGPAPKLWSSITLASRSIERIWMPRSGTGAPASAGAAARAVSRQSDRCMGLFLCSVIACRRAGVVRSLPGRGTRRGPRTPGVSRPVQKEKAVSRDGLWGFRMSLRPRGACRGYGQPEVNASMKVVMSVRSKIPLLSRSANPNWLMNPVTKALMSARSYSPLLSKSTRQSVKARRPCRRRSCHRWRSRWRRLDDHADVVVAGAHEAGMPTVSIAVDEPPTPRLGRVMVPSRVSPVEMIVLVEA
jgi:hypothetical protein